MNWWQKLTADWLCALGDWLWARLVVDIAAALDRLTWRIVLRVGLQIALFAILLAFFQQIMALDLSWLFLVDVSTYPEIIAGIFAAVAAGFAGQTLGAAARAVRPQLQNGAKALLRFASRQRRNANALRAKAALAGPNNPTTSLLRGSALDTPSHRIVSD